MANTFETIITDIETHFGNNWSTRSIPVRMENISKLVGTTKDVTELEHWISLNIFIANSDIAELVAGGTKRVNGFLIFNVFNKEGSGTRKNWQTVDALKDIFEQKTINNITFRAGNPTNVGINEGFHQVSLNIPFHTYVKG